MLIHARRLLRDEEGQTLVLGAVAMLILALAVMSTVNIGHVAYEKIKLQNTADSAAYSLAATQARVFNFYAYTNRAMICHYNSMLTIIAYLSYAVYLQNTLGRIATVLQFIPYIGTVASIIKRIIDYTVKALKYLAKIAIPGLGLVNAAYFLFQLGMFAVMQTALLTQPDVVQDNDPDAKTEVNLSNLGMGDAIPAMAKVANVYSVNRVIDYKRMMQLIPGTNDWRAVKTPGDEGNEARIIMSELINNARHEWVAGSKDGIKLLGRRWTLRMIIPGIGGLSRITLTKGARTEHGMMPAGSVNDKHDQIYSVDQFKIHVKSLIFGYWWQLLYESIVKADYKQGGISERADITRKHCCRFCFRCKAGRAIVDPFVEPIGRLIQVAVRAANQTHRNEKIAKYFGVTPFMKFDPTARWRQGFNQPDFMVVANKDDDKLNTYSDTYQKKIHLDYGVAATNNQNPRGEDSTLDFKTDLTGDGWLSDLVNGMNAISVARTYYHRPGEWKEHPNFFNPFWAAKLHPVAHHSFIGEVPHLANFGDEIITH